MNRLVLVLGLLFATNAVAASSNQLLNELQHCKAVTDSAKRLACFDAIQVPNKPEKMALSAKTEQLKQVEVEATSVKPRMLTKQEFGLKNIIKEPEYINLTVEKVKKNSYGEITVYLQEGQVWKQNDDRALRLRPNDKVIIKKGSFNSFNMMKAEGSRTMRVKRIK